MTLATAAALVLLAIAAAAAGRREAEVIGSRVPGAVRRLPWEVGLLILAGAAYYTLVNRGIAPVSTGDEPARIDVFVVIFPLLLIAGGAALAGRALGRVLPRLSAVGPGWPPALWLASRRLAAASGLALTLVAGSALAFGILAYAGILVASVDATATAKAQVSTGSDMAGVLPTGAWLPPDLPFPATEVHRVDQMTLRPAGVQASLLTIDPATFAAAAFWDDGFADRPLPALLDELERRAGTRLPVVVAGGSAAGDEPSLELFSTSIPLEVRAAVEAWPGMAPGRPTVIAARDAVDSVLAATGGSLAGANQAREVWAEGDPGAILRELRARDVSVTFVRTAENARRTPALLAVTWTFEFLRAIGGGAGLVVLAGLLLYLQARQRAGVLSFAIARRMGLRAVTFGLAVIIELMVLLVVALATGAVLSIASVGLVYRDLDVLPELPPDPLLRLPLLLLAATAVVVLIAAVLGGWRAQRSAEKANIAEVLRLAG